MTARQENTSQIENPGKDVEPSTISRSYMEDAHQEALRFDPEEKKLRDEAKAKLTQVMVDTLDQHGIRYQESIKSKKTANEFEHEVKETPMIPFPLEGGMAVGVRLSEELVVIQKFENGIFEKEEPVVGMIHLSMHDLETGEQLGRNSAGVLGADFVTNAAKGQATRQQIEGMTDIVRYIDNYLVTQMENSGQSSLSFSPNGEVPREN